MHWINVTDQLPAEQERVLLYTPYKVLGTDHACIGDREAITACTTRKGRNRVPVFTHWMPLPGLPEQSR
jgi:hypothetical protein